MLLAGGLKTNPEVQKIIRATGLLVLACHCKMIVVSRIPSKGHSPNIHVRACKKLESLAKKGTVS